MPPKRQKVSVVDISNPSNFQTLKDFSSLDPTIIQEITANTNAKTGKNDTDDAESEDPEEIEGLIPRLLFSTFNTLTILVPLYAQDFDILEIVWRAITAAIVLIFLIAAVHPRREAPVIRGALFCAFVAFGVAMVRVSRDGAYYAVMKRAPGIGTVLIFCAVEMSIVESFVGLVILAGYALWDGNGTLF